MNPMKSIFYLIYILSFILLFSCAAKKPYINTEDGVDWKTNPEIFNPDNIDYELFLVGDIATSNNNLVSSDIVDLIKTELKNTSIKQSVVFLGNSTSNEGFPDVESPAYAQMDRELDHCINVLSSNTDKVFFIPGNSEWYNGKDYSSAALNEVEEYIESKADGKNIFVPSHGCGRPKLVDLTDDLMLLIIDSQWVLEGDRSDERKRSSCEIDYVQDLIIYIDEKLGKNKNKNVIIAAHHPIYSNGVTGGNYGLKSNLLPLPILGSIITGIKKLGAGEQKFGHPQYEVYRSAIKTALDNHEGIIFASAHDKNLQYHLEDKNHHVIAGSGSVVDFVRKGSTANFALMDRGFAKITHTKDLELWLEFYTPDPDNPKKVKTIYNKRLYKKEFINFQDTSIYHRADEYEKTHKAVASEKYAKGVPGLGKTYRKEWGTELDFPVLLLDEYSGGLTPIQQGGGFQTKSLRLEDPEGRQWVVRTVDKDVSSVVPSILRETFVQDIVQDGISAAHPYAASVVPKMAEALGIYHANPKIVWMPKQRALGDYNIDFGDRIYLFEERAGGEVKSQAAFQDMEDAISTSDLLEKLEKNHKHKVDEAYVLRARLFDLLIGDWDRHDDQWRWGVFEDEETGGKIYRAIPRDRDQVFFFNDGLLNYVVSRPYFNPALRKYDAKIYNLDGLIYNARHFDRSFLSQLTKEDFLRIAKEVQVTLTDDVIQDAFRVWPKEIYDINGDAIVEKLKQRREVLVGYAEQFFEIINKEVTVVGTDKPNLFNVTALPDDKLDVQVYSVEDDEEFLIWSRMLNGEDCNELRLMGLKKADVFSFTGNEDSSIKVKIVGGNGQDLVNNSAENLAITVYDRKDGMQLKGDKVKSHLKNRRGIDVYDRLDWKLDRSIHFPIFDFYTDEGLGLKYNFWWINNSFRKNPYASSHQLGLAYFTTNSAIVADYDGHWASIFGPDWDFRVNVEATGPVFTQFFYGLGNEYINYEEELSEFPQATDNNFFIVKGNHVFVESSFVYNLGNNRTLRISPSTSFLNIPNEPDEGDPRFIFLPEANRDSFDFDTKIYVGLGLNYEINRVNNDMIPTRGYEFNIAANYRHSLRDSEFRNITFESTVTAYVPFSPSHRIVFATELGAAYTVGDYEFFHANYLSTRSRMRGFRRSRFAGDGIAYAASDLRIKLFQGHKGLRTGVGVFGSFDYGRAFLEGDGNDDWHTSVGGGLFFTPLDLVGFKFGYFQGQDDTQIVIGGSIGF